MERLGDVRRDHEVRALGMEGPEAAQVVGIEVSEVPLAFDRVQHASATREDEVDLVGFFGGGAVGGGLGAVSGDRLLHFWGAAEIQGRDAQ